MVDRATLLRNLPPYKNDGGQLITDNQNTGDIMDEVYDAHLFYESDYDRIYKFFDTGNIINDCRTLFDFCKKYIPYEMESEEDQTSRSPAAILTLGNGDCKHYASFIGGVVAAIHRNTQQKFKWCYRYGNYDSDSDVPGHVFVVVNSNGNEVWVDPVLPRFNKRFQPNFYIDDKISDEMLRRISGIDQSNQPETMESLLSNPEIANALIGIDTSVNVPYDLADAINILMDYGVMNVKGEIDIDALQYLLNQNYSDVLSAFNTIQGYADNATMGSFFGDVFKGIQHFAAGMGMQVPRAAFLGLIKINGFGYATKLQRALQYTDTKAKLADLWERVGGTFSTLENTINSGATKKAILGGIGCNCGGGKCMGCVDGASTAVCLIASAALIIAAIMPVITKLIAAKAPAPDTTGVQIDPNTGMPVGYNGSGNSIVTWLQQNPVLAIGGVLLLGYFLTAKTKRA